MILLISVVGKTAEVSICSVRLHEKEGLVEMGEEKERVPSPSLFHHFLPLSLSLPSSPSPPSSIIPSFSLPHIISFPPSFIIPSSTTPLLLLLLLSYLSSSPLTVLHLMALPYNLGQDAIIE